VGVVKQSIEHGCGQRLIICERGGPLRKWQVASQHHAALFVAFGHYVEEQICFLAAEWQITDLTDDQKLRTQDGAIEVLLAAPEPWQSIASAQNQPQQCLRLPECRHQAGQ
jgi:hypothetical protein